MNFMRDLQGILKVSINFEISINIGVYLFDPFWWKGRKTLPCHHVKAEAKLPHCFGASSSGTSSDCICSYPWGVTLLILFLYDTIWMFPKIWENPPNHPFVHRVFHYKPSILGYPYFWKHPSILSINIWFDLPNSKYTLPALSSLLPFRPEVLQNPLRRHATGSMRCWQPRWRPTPAVVKSHSKGREFFRCKFQWMEDLLDLNTNPKLGGFFLGVWQWWREHLPSAVVMLFLQKPVCR